MNTRPDPAAVIAAVAARKQAAADEARLARALALWHRAQDWPRCGADWAQPWDTPTGRHPADRRELEAEAVLVARESRGDGWLREEAEA